MRLIDADELKKLFPDNGEGSWTYNITAKMYIDNAPTVEPKKVAVADVAFDKEQLEEIVEKAKAEVLASIETQNKWTPVSERLPEIDKEVIVTDIETEETYCSWYHGNGYWECDNGVLKNRIIAWQPLPEPYKAGGKEE